MSSRSPYGKVQVHQDDDIHSSYSYSSDPYSSSGSSTPRSYSSSSGNYREYGATKHSSGVRRSGQNLVIQHNQVGYTHGDPSPGYVGGYSRK